MYTHLYAPPSELFLMHFLERKKMRFGCYSCLMSKLERLNLILGAHERVEDQRHRADL